MKKCEYFETCGFFDCNIVYQIPLLAKTMKENFCLGDSSKCARFMVFKVLKCDSVPSSLIPSQIRKAEKIINDAGKKLSV
ncbi:MAG: hypothetical protein ABIC40_08355 [bacterium]